MINQTCVCLDFTGVQPQAFLNTTQRYSPQGHWKAKGECCVAKRRQRRRSKTRRPPCFGGLKRWQGRVENRGRRKSKQHIFPTQGVPPPWQNAKPALQIPPFPGTSASTAPTRGPASELRLSEVETISWTPQ